MNFEEIPESARNELCRIFCFRVSSDMILSTLMRLSRELPGFMDSQELFNITKLYLIENKIKISENMKQFEKTVKWSKIEESELM